ncbi:hypothetical protein ACFWPQ_45935 [Streptomyces sp. NPDC058464]|uniref:hypothetical protein n=1 Tax=Streptomyces sp. NPDC058464 TaxID=3346511 RepID=UPI00364BE3A7
MTGLVAGAAGAGLLDGCARPPGPLTVVGLDCVTAPVAGGLERAVRCARGCGRLLVGRAGWPVPGCLRGFVGVLDLTLVSVPRGRRCAGDAVGSRAVVAVTDPVAGAEHLRVRMQGQSGAVLVVHQVLGTAGRLPVPGALDVESMAYSMLLGGAGVARRCGFCAVALGARAAAGAASHGL